MKLAADLGGRTVVLYDGHVEEAGDTRALLDHPRHPYTRGLLQSAVGLNPVRDMWGIRPTTVSYTRQPHGCPFYGRCTQSLPACAGHAPELTAQPDGRLLACNRGGVLTLLECRGLCKAFGRQRCWTASTSPSTAGRSSPWWAAPARARPPWPAP